MGARALVVGVIAGLLALSGCGGEDPVAQPSVSPSLSASSSSPTAPNSSATAQPETPEEFIRRWAKANNAMKNSGDPSEFLSLTKSCAACRRVANTVSSYFSAGGFVKTDGWTVHGIKPENGSPRREPVFYVDVVTAPTRYKESSSGPVKTYPGGTTQYRVTLLRTHAGYFVEDYMEVSQ